VDSDVVPLRHTPEDLKSRILREEQLRFIKHANKANLPEFLGCTKRLLK
jgi:hypothetical protein